MTEIKNTYSLSKIKQLINLNGELVNFDLTFRIVAKNKEPFEALVVDQLTLDNSPTLQYKKIEEGELSGNISNNNNTPQTFFLIMRSDPPCEVDIEINRREIPPAVITPLLPKKESSFFDKFSKKNDGFSWVKILLVIGGVAVIGILVFWYLSKDKDNSPRTFGNRSGRSENGDTGGKNSFLDFMSKHKKGGDELRNLARSPAQSSIHEGYQNSPTVGRAVGIEANTNPNPFLTRLQNLKLN